MRNLIGMDWALQWRLVSVPVKRFDRTIVDGVVRTRGRSVGTFGGN